MGDTQPEEDGLNSEDVAARKAQTRAIFDRVTPDYDTAGPGCFAHFGRRLVEVVGVEAGQRVLDVATGRGAVLLPAAERAGPTGSVVGIDLSEEMIRAARQESERHGRRVTVQVEDAERLSFPDASFDRVLCGFGIMFFPNLEQALRECRRVLKAGGRLGVSSWHVTQADDLAIALGRLGLIGPGGDEMPFREPAVLERALRAAGFRDVRVLVDPATFHYVDLDQYWQNARGTGLRRWLDALDAAAAIRVKAALAEQLRACATPDGFEVEASALLAVASP